MKIKIILSLIIFSFVLSSCETVDDPAIYAAESVYDFKVQDDDQSEISLSDYEGKVLLLVNTATDCGLTPQFEGLQELYENYEDDGFEVLGFPSNQFAGQEPLSDSEITEFCQKNFGVDFEIFAKTIVHGEDKIPLYDFLVKTAPYHKENAEVEWNFAKFLVGQNGSVYKRYHPTIEPEEIEDDIEFLLNT
mgnify:CR=1 FL=1